MKKTTFAVLFSVLLIFSCIFASCKAGNGLFSEDDTTADASSALYSAKIRELEARIVELQQSQYISDAESREELERLQTLLVELKGQLPSDTIPTTDTTPPADQTNNTAPNTENAERAEFLYIREGDSATVTGYTGEEEHLVIPSIIDGYAVTAIADNAFSSDTLKSVVIPNGVLSIGWFAFQDCPALLSVTVPASVTAIGYSAFPSTVSAFTIFCPEDSFAQKYAASYGIGYAHP